ncbi:DUF4347 domain-containing protein [Flavobacterium sp. CBA20B-1]|uniref:RHS repeat-associated core domain-containing protein n=1 Tax=unclassified Flavobacterium TaxID=196869 RepID=UPI0022240309|nr:MULTISPECIES: RHS repeat-associated core domain-containing protein [unclassified Flavobacterium]WCM41744.1 DUF4347 domain-containing protein [Flavobacterium sp. CBA20B-1]
MVKAKRQAGKECGCIRDEEEEMQICAEDCANPQASECYEYYAQTGVWMDGCEQIMIDCGCLEDDGSNNELDCFQQALNYIRVNLTFEPNNACAVLDYVLTNFNCSPKETVRPDTPEFFPDLDLPTPHPESNDDLPGEDGPYREEERKPIWWYHTDHLGSSTYLTDNFGRPSHYYETLPFGEMIVEHNQSANHPSGVGYDNKFKFNGKELDDATQMYYYGARYYDPRISIFVSVDPLAEDFVGWTPYHYVHNNPINLIDPTGMSAVYGEGGPKNRDGYSFVNYKPGSDIGTMAVIPSNYNSDSAFSMDYNNAKQSGTPIMLVDDISGFSKGLSQLKTDGSDVGTFALTSHGNSGSFSIGSTKVNNKNSSSTLSALGDKLSGKNLVVLACNTGRGDEGAELTQSMSKQLDARVITSQHLLIGGYRFNGGENMLKSLNPKDSETMNSFTVSARGQQSRTVFNLSMNKNDKSPSYSRSDTNRTFKNSYRAVKKGFNLGSQNNFIR